MSDQDRLNLASKDLKVIVEHHAIAKERLDRQLRGQPGSGFGGGGGGRGSSSPVESALGLGGPGENGGIRSDQAARKLDAVNRLMANVCRDLHLLARLVQAEVPRQPTDKERREVERVNETQERLCEHCTDHRRLGDAQPVHRTGDVAGNLPHPMALCRWCYDRVRSDGRLPNGDRLERLKSFKADAVRV